jgi:hypothetical protein
VKHCLLLFLMACGSTKEAREEPIVDKTINETTQTIRRFNEKILEIEKLAMNVQSMMACLNRALDSKMNDRDQIMTIEECMRAHGYRR